MAKESKSGLGRGLSSLIGGYEASFKSENEDVSRETKDNEHQEEIVEESVVSRETVKAEDYLKDVSRETMTSELIDKVSNEVMEVESSRDPSTTALSASAQDEEEDKITGSQDNVKNVSRETQAVSEEAINAEEAEPQVFIREVNEEKVEEEEKSPELMEIEVDLIEPNPEQPRMNFDEQKLQELAHSIKDQGVLQPIVVRENGDMFQIIAGERRWQASRIAGLESIPCVIQQVDDDKALELGLIENIQRDDLNPIEEAYTYKRLMDKMNYTQAELAKAVAKGRSTIANAIRLLDLPEEAQEAMFNKQLTAGHARAILSVPSAKGRKKLTDKIITEKMSVREAESLARLLSIDTASNVRTNANNIPAAYTAMAKSLKEVLKTQVRVKKTKTGTKLEISFKNEEELRIIYEKLIEE